MVNNEKLTWDNVVFEKHSPSRFLTVYRIIDKNSGTILFEREESDIKRSLAADMSAFTALVDIRKNTTPDGAHCYSVTDPDGEIIFVGWQSGSKIRQRGGKKSYVKLHPERLELLTDDQVLALVKLAPYLKTTGLLTDKSRRRCLTKQAIIAAWQVGKNKGLRLWRELEEAGIIHKDDTGFFIDREYICRG